MKEKETKNPLSDLIARRNDLFDERFDSELTPHPLTSARFAEWQTNRDEEIKSFHQDSIRQAYKAGQEGEAHAHLTQDLNAYKEGKREALEAVRSWAESEKQTTDPNAYHDSHEYAGFQGYNQALDSLLSFINEALEK